MHLFALSLLFVFFQAVMTTDVHAQLTVTLLGTGTPIPEAERFGPATLIEAGPHKLLIDAGRGASIRLWQRKVPLGRIDALFLTHYHSDHTSGLADLWLTSLLRPPFGRREEALTVYGPPGLRALTTNLRDAYADDIRIRMGDALVPSAASTLQAVEFNRDGVIFDKDGVKVTAFEVDHGAKVKPAYGYRIDYAGHAVLVSGDTRYSENLVRHGKGVDLVIHQVAMSNPALASASFMQAILSHHSTPQDVARVFSETKPKVGVFTHFALFGNDKFAAPTAQDVLEAARKVYAGPMELGVDLMSFEVAETVKVVRPGR